MKTEKKCRGTGKALGHGCGKMVPVEMFGKANRKYGIGISCGCWQNWLINTQEGSEHIQKNAIASKRKNEKQAQQEWNETKRRKRPYTHYKENKKALNDEIQKLARMIDARYGHTTCIDCGRPFGNQIDGGHFHSKGSNPSIRLNLHNIHSQRSECNQNGLGGGRERGYMIGLEQRYGKEYAEMVDTEIVRKYPYIGLKEQDIADKLKLVRKLVREFETFQFKDAIHAREQLNQIIGIYK